VVGGALLTVTQYASNIYRRLKVGGVSR